MSLDEAEGPRKCSTQSVDEADYAAFTYPSQNKSQCSHVIFGILKYQMVHLIRKIGWEPVKESFMQQGLEILLRSRYPFRFSADFWLQHYKNTITQKEEKKEGSGEKYREKILKRLADTDGLPVLVAIKGEDNHLLLTADELRDLKLKTRTAVAALFPEGKGEKRQLLHLSDDNLAAQTELALLNQYLRKGDAYSGIADDKEREEVRRYVNLELIPKLGECEAFIRNCANDENKSCRGLRQYLRQPLDQQGASEGSPAASPVSLSPNNTSVDSTPPTASSTRTTVPPVASPVTTTPETTAQG